MASTTNVRQPYQYQPLATSSQIRLLRFLSETTEQDVCCEMTAWDFAGDARTERPPFAAISYVWGSNEDPREICLDGKPFTVRRNCYEVLLQVYYHLKTQDAGGVEYFWIDAICINQLELDEKSRQVRHMGQIYTKANLTLACLKPEKEEDGSCIDFISWLCYASVERAQIIPTMKQFIGHMFPVVPSTSVHPEVHFRHYMASFDISIFQFCNNVYWTRRWILQELTTCHSTSQDSMEQQMGAIFGDTGSMREVYGSLHPHRRCTYQWSAGLGKSRF